MSRATYAKKRNEQLGMDAGVAVNRLRRIIMFELAKEAGRATCFRCGKPIEVYTEFSVDHKEPWLDSSNPNRVFFDWNNIAFSHLFCNIQSNRGGTSRKGIRRERPASPDSFSGRTAGL